MSNSVNGQTASRVEYGRNSSPVGVFSQVNAHQWLETNGDNRGGIRFGESGRDAWSVYLHDSGRGVSIQLDLYTKKVMYSDASSASRRELYDILGAANPPAEGVFRSLKEFNAWYASGGEQRSGLPNGAMRPLSNTVQDVRVRLSQVVHDLENMQKTWRRIESGGATKLVEVLMGKFVGDMTGLHLQVGVLVQIAAQGRVLVQGGSVLMREHMKVDRAAITSANSNVTSARARQTQARRDLQAAKSELSGSKGFGNAFLTGLTFTAYNPVQENIDKANKAVAIYNAQIGNIRQQLARLEQSTRELAEGSHTLGRLSSVNSALKDYQNVLSKSGAALKEGHEDAERAASAMSKRLGAYYRKKAGKEMIELFGWIDAFKTVR